MLAPRASGSGRRLEITLARLRAHGDLCNAPLNGPGMATYLSPSVSPRSLGMNLPATFSLTPSIIVDVHAPSVLCELALSDQYGPENAMMTMA
ncbi:MAG: hypothetical protein AUH30_10665 [Candidatus Rokubacteria bacterium 13_1_40CM_68_15]|nr:MAG: hypothetical protein AUH30_10665 [Candidatus Rokubacteria bacterium 13_1_40CM_68_15]